MNKHSEFYQSILAAIEQADLPVKDQAKLVNIILQYVEKEMSEAYQNGYFIGYNVGWKVRDNEDENEPTNHMATWFRTNYRNK